MIPYRDPQSPGKKPYVTYTLIALNLLIFVFMMLLPENAIDSFLSTWELVPAQIFAGHNLYTLLTSMFLHASLGHVLGNMLFLYIFGDNLENSIGHAKYLIYYLLCGIVAALAQVLIDPTSTIPLIGASGAVAGVMGGYLALFPDHRIDVFFKLGPFLSRGSVPAWAMLIYWFVAQLFNGVGSLAMTSDLGGVAYFAHIGGFVFGYGIVKLFQDKIRRKNEVNPEYLWRELSN